MQMKKISIFLFATLSCLLIRCQFNTQEFFVLEKIDVYDNPEKNEQLGKDLLLYDYQKLIKDSTNITDESIFKNITYEYFVQSDNNEVTFRLYLKNSAIQEKDTLVKLFDNFIKNKINAYKLKRKQIDTATQMGLYFIKLIQRFQYDSVWQKSSGSLEKYTSKEKFINMLKERNEAFKSLETPKVITQLISTELDSLKGNFYTINYEYQNKTTEQITLEETNNNFGLLGYHFGIPNK